jgi:N-acetylglucosaminyldiphosphoundecaprenol N-acetyl-beta-D-mannosaminyltransferase
VRASHLDAKWEQVFWRCLKIHNMSKDSPVQHLAEDVHGDRFRVLGVRVDAVQISKVIQQMEAWIQRHDACHFIAVTGMHGVMEAQHNDGFKHVLNSADLVVPDGMPLVWLGRLRGFPVRRRVYGPELMMTFCQEMAPKGYRHFFLGGTTDLPEKLSESLRRRIPLLQIAGTFSPPFGPVTPEEDEATVTMINATKPDVVWVGLSEIKQDTWMYEHRGKLNVPVLVGIGAAFDFLAGTKTQAPEWMRENGLEWLFRLLQEPRRLWRRYLIYGTEIHL